MLDVVLQVKLLIDAMRPNPDDGPLDNKGEHDGD